MTDLRKAAEMALGVLLDPKSRADEVADAVKTIRQALAQPEQEPVAWSDVISDGGLDPRNAFNTAPPKREWVGFTDEEREPVLKFKVTVIDDEHPNGIPLEQWGNAAPPKREWVGLTEEERFKISRDTRPYIADTMRAHEEELKRRNT